MENIATAQPWQIAFFLIGCMVVAVAIAVWVFSGNKATSEPVTLDPIVLVGQLWMDILHWRLIPMSSGNNEKVVRDEKRTSSESPFSGSSDPVLPHQPQLEPDSETVCEPEREPATLHRMSRVEEIAMLTVQRNDDGTYRHSANKIADLMGGTASEVKAQVAAIRGPAKPAQAPPTGRVTRPADGWKAKAS